jgi:hypothetical protein
MVMIVKDHEKQAHGFISVTRLPRHPRRPGQGGFRPGGQPGAVRASRLPSHAGARKARTLALGAHCSEQ